MVSGCKLGGTINQTGVKGGKSKRSKYHCSLFLFPFLRARASRGSRLTTHLSFDRSKNARKRKILLAVYHRTVSMTAVHQLKIKYDQDKFDAVFICIRHDEKSGKLSSWR